MKVKRAEGRGPRAEGQEQEAGVPPPLDAEAQRVLAGLRAPEPRRAARMEAVPEVRPERGSKRPPLQQVRPQQVRRGERRSGPVDDGHTPATQRLFYALKVPPAVAQQLSQAQKHLKGNWRAVRVDQLHVTLVYLPAVPPERVPQLRALGQRLAAQHPALDVRLRGTGYFPNEGSPRVWFVKVESEGLDALAAALRDGIQQLGLPLEDLPFKAHITLARKKGPAPRVPPLTFDVSWRAPGVTLQRSLLQKTGPIYELAGSFRFRNDPAPTATPPPAATPSEPGPSEPTPTSPPTQETP